MADSAAFLDVVLGWMHHRFGVSPSATSTTDSAQKVTAVTAYGASPASYGYHAGPRADVTWLDRSGREHRYTAEGDDFVSLWEYVINRWPAL